MSRATPWSSARRLAIESMWLLLLCGLTSSCVRRPYPSDARVVSDIEIVNAKVVSASAILERLATVKSGKFLGLWDGILFEYEVFDEAILARDLERIERFYRARGYYEAKVTAARVMRVDEHRVRVEISVVEGRPVVVASEVQRFGLEALDLDLAIATYAAVTMRKGDRLDEDEYEQAKRDIATKLANAGYAFAKVTGKVEVTIARHEAKVSFFIEPGPPATYGKIRIVGLRRVPASQVRRNLQLSEGDSYSEAELQDARRALLTLGVFNSVRINADRKKPKSRRVPITVVVQEAPLRTLKLGGGLRLDAQQTSSHLSTGWEHRNFMGGLRRLEIDARSGVVLFPTRINNIEAPNRLLLHSRVGASLTQPSFIEGRTTGALTAGFQIYPLLYSESTANDPIIGFISPTSALRVERAFLDHRLFVSSSYNWQAHFPLGYDPLTIGRKIGVERESRLIDVVASFPEFRFSLDARNDPVEPRNGAYFANSLQWANSLLAGTVSDVKVRPELRFYYEFAPGWVLAWRGTVGFLIPRNYATTLEPAAREDALLEQCTAEGTGADPDPDVDACQMLAEDEQKLLVRGFFSGGPSSNRGYGIGGVGPHRALGFLSRGNIDCTSEANRDSRACLRPVGGLTLWEASAELRLPLPVSESWRLTVFADGSDVTRGLAEFRGNALHLSTGVGLRYLTPVGPLRIDFGVRLPGLQAPGIDDNDPSTSADGEPPLFFGLVPASLNIALGEAF